MPFSLEKLRSIRWIWPKQKRDLFDVESEIEQLHSQIKESQLALKVLMGTQNDLILPMDQMISVAGINSVISRFREVESIQLPLVQLAAHEVEEQYIQWQIDRQSDNRWIDFIQARVRGDELGFARPDFSLGLGLNFPLPRDNKQQNAINELQWRMAKSQLEIVRDESSSLAYSAQEKLSHHINRWEQLHHRINEGLTRRTLDRIREQEAQEPLTLVLLEEQLLLQQLILMEIEQRIYEQYLLWLEAYGHLSTEAPRNFLSSGLELLD